MAREGSATRGKLGGVKRILVVKLADLGDVLTVTPAIRALRNAHPKAHIGALVSPGSSSILRGSDLVDEIIPFEKKLYDRPAGAAVQVPLALALGKRLRAGKWDALALFHHLTTAFGVAKYATLCLASRAPIIAGLDNGRGWFLNARVIDEGFGARHEVDNWLAVARLLGGHNGAPRLEVPVTADDRAWADAQRAAFGLSAGQFFVVHPGSGAFSLARRWPAERYGAVARQLAERHALTPVILNGTAPDEAMLARAVALHADGAKIVGPAPSPGALVAFLAQARLFIGNESGVMHMTVAAGTPIVAVFGPTNDRAWGPYPLSSPRHAVVREELACAPCVHRGHAFGTPAGCEARTCLDLIEPSAVIAAAEQVLARTESPTGLTSLAAGVG